MQFELKQYISCKVRQLLIFTLSLIMLLTACQLNVYATGGSMIGADKGQWGEIMGGPDNFRTGWLFYLIDLDNNQVTDTKAISSEQDIVTRDGTKIPAGNLLLRSRYGIEAVDYNIGAPWGKPYLDGHGRGGDVKQYMLDDYGGKPYAYSLIEENWGTDFADQWYSREVYLAFEPFYWHNIHVNQTATGEWICTTAYYWGAIQAAKGIDDTGDPLIASFTNGVYCGCVALEDCQEIRDLGMTAPAFGNWKRTNAEMNTFSVGNGMGIVWNEDSMIHTYWKPNGSPGDPEPSDPPKDGVFNIVKSYYTDINNGASYTNDGTFFTPNCTNTISIDDEPEYKIVSWKVTNVYNNGVQSTDGSSITWNPPGGATQSGTSSQMVELKTPEKCLYVLLKREETEEEEIEGNYIISESTITRKVNFSNPDSWDGMAKMHETTFKWSSLAHKHSCSHSYTDNCKNSGEEPNKHCGGHTASCTWGEFTDNKVKLSLKNSQQSNNEYVLATRADLYKVTGLGGSTVRRTVTGDRGTMWQACSFNIDKWDYACVLLRGRDKLTLAEWKNTDLGVPAANTDLKEVSSQGFHIANTVQGTRKTEDYSETFQAKFVDDSDDLSTTYKITADSGHGACAADTQAFKLTNPLIVNVGVAIETYSGSADGGTNDTTCDSSVRKNLRLLGFNKTTGKEVPSGGTVSFNPYVQMNYDVLGSPYEKKAYVLGQYQRSITPNDYAEISWNKRDSVPNLTLNSLQWSTHSSAVDFIQSTFGVDKLSEYKVLPGGATLGLSIKKGDQQKIRLTTYQCVVTGSGKTQVDNTGGSDGGLNEAQAKAAHEAYVLDVIDTLERLNVEQWITTDTGSAYAWDTGSAIGPGTSLADAGHSSQTGSTEEKYYFRGDGELPNAIAGEGDIDVYPNPNRDASETLNVSTTYYTFFVNTFGEIRYTVNNTSPNVGDEYMGNPVGDTTSLLINNRTHIIDKLEAALEHGTGDDGRGRSKTGRRWYNEAFDGITVMVQTTDLELGYVASPERSVVLDPKVTQTQTSQSDMFNKAKYNLSQYRNKPFSDKYSGDNDRIGTFKNASIYTDELNMYFWSQKFFIPNATVDDLH